MGMFDSILYACPDCGNIIEEQSKAGECILNTYDENKVPLAIACDIEGDTVYCEKCNESFVQRRDYPVDYVGMFLTKRR